MKPMVDPPVPRATRTARALSGVGLIASCLPMVTMLPAAATGVLAFVGLGASSAATTTLAPALNEVAQPLLLISAALMAVSGLRCSRAAVAFAAGGGMLLYLGMYVLTRSDGTTSPILFYPGLALFFGAYLVGWRQRRGLRCRPMVSPLLASRLLAGTLVLGTSVIVATAVSTSPAGSHGANHSGMTMPGHGSGRSTSPGSTPGMSR